MTESQMPSFDDLREALERGYRTTLTWRGIDASRTVQTTSDPMMAVHPLWQWAVSEGIKQGEKAARHYWQQEKG